MLDVAKLQNVKHKEGGNIVAACPACRADQHDASGNHLTIFPNGKFGCCQFPREAGIEHRKRIFELVGIPDQEPKKKTKGRRVFATLEEAINYQAGKLRMLVTRRDAYNKDFVIARFDKLSKPEDKEFRPFHRNSAGWIVKDPPGKLPLFHLPELLARPNEIVFLGEGEKVACRLSEIGLLAVTSAHGSKGADKTDWTPLAGRKVVILPDNDNDGEKYAQTVGKLLISLSPPALVRVVELPDLPPKGDCVEWIANGGDAKQLIALAENAPEWKPITSDSAGQLSFRSPDEILAMPRNPKANFLGDKLLGIGRSLVFAGIGGLGKSRLILQLLVDFILERIWCGIETHHTKGKPWLVLQTQNGIDRLQDDLERLKKYAGNKWSLVNENLKIHTLETDRDLILHLSDPRNARDVESVIRDYNPLGTAFDPLNEFGIGDLSKDVDMIATCHEIARISRAGNPERAIIIATHAITGVAGMKKAFGFEAAGFGRNSKMLQSWSRAFINVIPGTEDHTILVLTCGKLNDGKPFAPFAVRLNPDTMIYEPEPDFDISDFRGRLESPKNNQQPSYDRKVVVEIEWPQPQLDKPTLAKLIQEHTGCVRSTAYRLIDDATLKRPALIRFNKQTELYAKI